MFFPLKGREKKEAEFSENAMFHPLEKNIFPSCTKTLFYLSKLLKLKFTRLALWILFFPKKKSSITLHPKKKNSKLPSFPLHRKIIFCSPEILLRRTIMAVYNIGRHFPPSRPGIAIRTMLRSKKAQGGGKRIYFKTCRYLILPIEDYSCNRYA